MSSTGGNHKPAAAFFDVDGTIVDSTIVHYYAWFRRRRMAAPVGKAWYGLFLVKCLYYLVLDRINRSRMNTVFYRSYRGLSADTLRREADELYEEFIAPRQFPAVKRIIEEHRNAGRRIVLVTGSLDFIMQPLARRLGVDHVVAPGLVESNGRFTGELTVPPIGGQEKARRLKAFADESGIDLAASYAFGDSIADLPMLESVGQPQAVNPDRALLAVARQRAWPVHRWTAKGERRSAET